MPKTLSFFTIASLALVCGCSATSQLQEDLQFQEFLETSAILVGSGIGVLTPSAPTGQEVDRQALGDALGETLASNLEGARVVTLPALLSAVNQAGLTGAYSRMFAGYEDTGILDRDILRQIGRSVDVRYFATLNLGDFKQAKSGRAAFFGVRFVETRTATIRIRLEIWDTWSGAIVWQGNEELTLAQEGVREHPISFQHAAGVATERLVAKIAVPGQAALEQESSALASTIADESPQRCGPTRSKPAVAGPGTGVADVC